MPTDRRGRRSLQSRNINLFILKLSLVLYVVQKGLIMIFQPKEITLKNGKTAILKTPEISDAAKMLAYITKACGETEFLIRYPEEWEGVTVETEEKWVENCRESKNTLAISCFIDGEIAGSRTGVEPNCLTAITFRVFRRAFTCKVNTLLRKIPPKSIKN